MSFKYLFGSSVLLLAACHSETPKPSETIHFLAFGDSGYHMDYLEPEEYNPPYPTPEAFIAMERAEWLEDKKPIADFRPSPMYFHPSLKSYVPASGLLPVSQAMKTSCKQHGCDFAVMLGDNIYPDGATLGADGHDDGTRFQKVFDAPYADLGLGKPGFKTYVTLGNHDWNTSREGALAQVDYLKAHPAFYIDGFFYRVKPAAANGLVELFIVDTELLLGSTTVYDDKLADDGSEIRHQELDKNDPWAMPQTDAEHRQLDWLREAMQNSDAKWKFLVAHHPVWASSGSKFEQGHALRKLLMPIACRYADAWFAGHEHTLELHEDSCAGTGVDTAFKNLPPLPQIVSGAAAKQRGANKAFMAYQNRTYPEKITHYVADMVWGFARVELSGDSMQVVYYTTPNDGGGVPVESYRHSLTRRSGKLLKN